MKHLRLLAVLFIASCFSSCNSTDEPATDVFPENGIISLTRDIKFSEPTKSGEQIPDFKITATFNIDTETLLGYTVSQKFLDFAGLTFEEFDQILKDNMGDAYYMQANDVQTKTANSETISKCIKTCKDDYTTPSGEKIPGRGWCKAGCWVELALEILPLLKL